MDMNNTDRNVLFFSSFCSFFYAHAILIVNLEVGWQKSTSLFLGTNSLLGSLACAGVCLRPLSADRKTFAMPKTLIASNIHLSLNILRNFASQVTFNRTGGFDSIT